MVNQILQDLERENKEGQPLSYQVIRKRIDERIRQRQFSPGQETPLRLRLQLLDGFMESQNGHYRDLIEKEHPTSSFNAFDMKSGSLTIVDLSGEHIDSSSACVLFNICLELYLDSDQTSGKVVALDEAHKASEKAQSDCKLKHVMTDFVLVPVHG